MSVTLLSAPPGYWFLRLTYSTDEDGALALIEGLVIAWQIRDDGVVLTPLTIDPMPKKNWDSALELPDGRCLADGGEIHPNRAAWLKQSMASYEESRAEEEETAVPAMMMCKNCHGKGVVLHKQRQYGDPPEPDRTDFQTHELCPKCDGSGLVPYKDDPDEQK